MRAAILLATTVTPTLGAKLIWQQSETTAIYTSASISRHAGKAPTFATATDLNQPLFVEVYNVSDSGENVWSFADERQGASFSVTMARHTEPSPAGAGGAVDTLTIDTPPPGVDGCAIRAFDSLGKGTPAWSLILANCSAYSASISDDGLFVAVSAGLQVGQPKLAPVVWGLSGQTGKVLWTQGGVDSSQYGGTVKVSARGNYIAYSRADDTVEVLDARTGVSRGIAISEGWNTPAELSDDGSLLAFSGQDRAAIYAYDAATAGYKLKYDLTPSGGSSAWYSVSTSVSSDGSGAEDKELACFGFIGAGALTARVLVVSMVSGAVLSDYTSATNDQLQTNPTVRMDGKYCGVSLWGDRDDVPTAVLLAANSSKPAFTYVTPGSMFGVDVVVDGTAVYFSVAGKHVPANTMGNGGDAYVRRALARAGGGSRSCGAPAPATHPFAPPPHPHPHSCRRGCCRCCGSGSGPGGVSVATFPSAHLTVNERAHSNRIPGAGLGFR